MSEQALQLRGVSKTFGFGAAEVRALVDVDLDVQRGELVAVMGPSGSGKSTLLTIGGGLEEPTRGEVLVDGVDLATLSRNALARLRRQSIGFVFQDFNLLAGLTAAENVSLPLELDGIPARRAPRHGARDARGLQPWQSRRRVPRRPLRRRAATRGDRPRRGRRPPAAARRRTDRCARLGQRRGCDAARRAPRAERGVAGVVVTHDAQLASWADRIVFLRDGRVVDQTMPPPGPESLFATR